MAMMTMESLLDKFGKRVRELRKAQELSQEKFGKKSGLHYTYVGAVERAERNLSLGSIKKIADGLNVDIAELFCFSQTSSPESQVREEIANLIRHKDYRTLRLILRGLKAILG